MNLDAWSPAGAIVDIAATVTGNVNKQALVGAGNVTQGDMHVRVCNNGTVNAFVAFGPTGVDASTDSRRVEVPPGERIFAFPPGSAFADAVMRSGTGTVSVQLGYGV